MNKSSGPDLIKPNDDAIQAAARVVCTTEITIAACAGCVEVMEEAITAAMPHLRKQIVNECVAAAAAVAGQMSRYAVTHALGAALAADAVRALLPDDNMVRIDSTPAKWYKEDGGWVKR